MKMTVKTWIFWIIGMIFEEDARTGLVVLSCPIPMFLIIVLMSTGHER